MPSVQQLCRGLITPAFLVIPGRIAAARAASRVRISFTVAPEGWCPRGLKRLDGELEGFVR